MIPHKLPIKLAAMSATSKVLSKNGISCNNSIKHPIKKESKNDPELGKYWASLGDVFVNDAFGAAHRKHASTYEINAFFENQNFGGF